VSVAADDLTRRMARLSATSAAGWDELAHAVGTGRPSFAGLTEALGLYLAEHDGRLWDLTEAGQRAIVTRAFDIDVERRARSK
jgi:hypothetical protein